MRVLLHLVVILNVFKFRIQVLVEAEALLNNI
jgi:hypothetical protein